MNAPPSPRSERTDRRILTLLSVLVALVALLLIGMASGAALAVREYRRVTASLEAGVGEARGGLAEDAGQLLDEVTARQARASRELERAAEATEATVRELRPKREAVEDPRGGLIKKLETMVRLQQLMSDQMTAMLRHMARTQEALAEAMRPLPTQRELADQRDGGEPREGVGGAGEREGVGGAGGAEEP